MYFFKFTFHKNKVNFFFIYVAVVFNILEEEPVKKRLKQQ